MKYCNPYLATHTYTLLWLWSNIYSGVRRCVTVRPKIGVTEVNMKTRRWSVLAMACLLLGACQDRRDPVKPTTVAQLASPAAASA